MSYTSLKKNSTSAISKLVEAAEKLNAPKQNYDNDSANYWNPTVDKSGNGYAIIRFLPAKEGEDLPWVQYWDHGFQGSTGRWYIEKSLTSIGQNDYLGEQNTILWNSGHDEDKETVRKRKRRLHFVANIEVISDSANPENEGKQFLYKYGKKIHDKLMEAMQPQFADEEPINPFDFWTGANFKLKIRNVEGYRNYDKSEFDKPSQHKGGDDAKLQAVYDNLHSLAEIVDPKNFKSYAELKAKYLQVVGETESLNSMSTAERISVDEEKEAPAMKTASAPESNSADDTLSYFAKLARGDD